MLTFDLQSLATLAAARALELVPPIPVDSTPPLRRILNLRRKCKSTPRPEPVHVTRDYLSFIYRTVHVATIFSILKMELINQRFSTKEKL